MKHAVSRDDRTFRRSFEALEVPAEDFDHRAHVRLAYIYLCEMQADAAHKAMKEALLGFLDHVGAERSKYHETITLAWIKAVKYFMSTTPECRSADEFIGHNPELLDTRIMLTHYSAKVLFSDEARARFVEPDIDPIP